MSIRTGSLSLFSVLAVAAFGCAGPGTSSESMELVLKAPGLEDVEPLVVDVSENTRFVIKRYVWVESGTVYPQAQLMFLRMKDLIRHRRIFVHTKSLPEFIDESLPGATITLGSRGTSENVLGELEYQRFQRSTSGECIYIEQGVSRFSDSTDVVGAGVPLGDMIVHGWYCVDPSDPEPNAAIRGFITGIGIRGWALPAGVSEQSPTAAAALIFEPGTFDGKWEGMMTCGSCVNCAGPLEKPVVVTIEDSRFELAPDLTYQGAGMVDGSGRMSIRWWPTTNYDWGTQLKRTFEFEGDFDGEKFDLSGVRGPRSCRITLHQVEEMKVR